MSGSGVYPSHMGDMRVSVDKQDGGEETGLRRGGKAPEQMSHRQSCPDPDRLITDSAHDPAQTRVQLGQPVFAVDVRSPTAPNPGKRLTQTTREFVKL